MTNRDLRTESLFLEFSSVFVFLASVSPLTAGRGILLSVIRDSDATSSTVGTLIGESPSLSVSLNKNYSDIDYIQYI